MLGFEYIALFIIEANQPEHTANLKQPIFPLTKLLVS